MESTSSGMRIVTILSFAQKDENLRYSNPYSLSFGGIGLGNPGTKSCLYNSVQSAVLLPFFFYATVPIPPTFFTSFSLNLVSSPC